MNVFLADSASAIVLIFLKFSNILAKSAWYSLPSSHYCPLPKPRPIPKNPGSATDLCNILDLWASGD